MIDSNVKNTRPSHLVDLRPGVLGAAVLLALLVNGCALQASDGAEPESIAETSEAITFEGLTFPLLQFPVEIKNVNSGKCLDIAGAGTANGTIAQQFTCNGGTNQTFYIAQTSAVPPAYQIRIGHAGNKNLNVAGSSLAEHAAIDISDVVTVGQIFGFAKQADGSYQIASKNSQKCLDVVNASTADNATVQQFTCTTGTNQRWTITPRGIGLSLIAKHSERCVDVADASTANNANVQQFDCSEGLNQKWSIGSTTVASGVSYFSLVSSQSGKCLDVAGASTANNANVQQFTCNGGDNQKWQMVENSDGYVTLKNKLSAKCLDVAGASTANNANVQQFTCGTDGNQRFYFAIFENRHVQVVQIAKSNGTLRQTQSDAAVADHVARANGVYGRYGLRLSYDAASDKSNVNSDALFALGESPEVTRTCPDGTVGTPSVCAQRFASANWPGKVVLLSRPGNAFTSGGASFIVIGQMGSNSTFVCNNVPDTQWVAHEFGHYLGLGHTFFGDGDLLSDTRPDPQADSCLAPHTATGVAPDGSIVDTNNPLSYYYNDAIKITPFQAGLARAGAFTRGF